MMFPGAPRVRYRRSPLVQVICQLRFPAILKIDRDPPVEFQEALRADLPGYQRLDVSSLAIVAGGQQVAIPPENADRRVEHMMLSADGQLRATLGRDFVALMSLSYPGWESFSQCLKKVVSALEAAYQPMRFERAGLRYQNVVRRSSLGLEQSQWSHLLRPSIVGLLGEAMPKPVHTVTEAIYDLDDGVRARIAHGLVKVDQEESYLIDSDFFFEGSAPFGDIETRLALIHEQAGGAFRWCIQDALHMAMEPEPIQ